ncbi:hypothetical protein FA09DRAFT_52047 [Tilletiopsis washingtonensis]|uniref:Uncharacterized protein n=1 Tax=Tilletiopsis washingtonensis TaxID=58919 RepID=A0A316ZAU5_9BASI|nr:hypothetical protein FA09DRAFT_52047 [Tilletiopsis washingtonensis]PWN97385.1 hypothetical protein FA09DRAFT_52047 [Tilletiopsis washingtonensis]
MSRFAAAARSGAARRHVSARSLAARVRPAEQSLTSFGSNDGLDVTANGSSEASSVPLGRTESFAVRVEASVVAIDEGTPAIPALAEPGRPKCSASDGPTPDEPSQGNSSDNDVCELCGAMAHLHMNDEMVCTPAPLPSPVTPLLVERNEADDGSRRAAGSPSTVTGEQGTTAASAGLDGDGGATSPSAAAASRTSLPPSSSSEQRGHAPSSPLPEAQHPAVEPSLDRAYMEALSEYPPPDAWAAMPPLSESYQPWLQWGDRRIRHIHRVVLDLRVLMTHRLRGFLSSALSSAFTDLDRAESPRRMIAGQNMFIGLVGQILSCHTGEGWRDVRARIFALDCVDFADLGRWPDRFDFADLYHTPLFTMLPRPWPATRQEPWSRAGGLTEDEVWHYVGRNRVEVVRMREFAERVEHEAGVWFQEID